jgi:DnaD/phage-associated family protein
VDEVGAALERLIEYGLFLAADVELGAGADTLYFLHNARGRAAVAAIKAGEWRLTGDQDAPVSIDSDKPNIYRLYEENIGPLSPMIAEALKDAEDSYSLIWIEKAIQLAVTNNARSWRYVEAILDRWQREGPDEQENRRDTEKDRRRYLQWENPD